MGRVEERVGGECIAELQFGLHPQSGTQIVIVSVTRKFKIGKLPSLSSLSSLWKIECPFGSRQIASENWGK